MMTVVLMWMAVTSGLVVPPLQVSVHHEGESFRVEFSLNQGLPQTFETALPSGATVRVSYPLQIRSTRRFWWDRKLWHGEVVATAIFDPVTGRYRCELILDEIIVASDEFGAVTDAREWLVSPPAVRIFPTERGRLERMKVRVRAVFSSSTRWFVFPVVEGTDWVEIELAHGEQGQPADAIHATPLPDAASGDLPIE